MDDVAALIRDYGWVFYPITFIWTFLEGETFVIFAGALAVPGLGDFDEPPINVLWLILFAWTGSFCGDQLYFLLGRRFGTRIIRRFPRIQGGVQLAIDLLHKYHTFFILTYRYMYGVRNFASFGMGMSGLSWPRFAALNFIAGFLWANSFAWGGYLLGTFAAAALDKINFTYILIGVLVFVFGVFGFVHYLGTRRYKRAVAKSIEAHSHDSQPPLDAGRR